MIYNSTRNSKLEVSASRAINDGISQDGGLFVPSELPKLDSAFFERLSGLDYTGRAAEVLRLFLDDFTDSEISDCVRGAYVGSFDNDDPAPLHKLSDNASVLELWHGPTCAFKDMALQLLPHLLTRSAKKTGDGKRTVILVATSGDTGKAALEGFKDVPDTDIIVFYPDRGVSNAQKLQMATQTGGNVFVSAINGNFDDAQSGVKRIFVSDEIKAKLSENGMAFSSANSINWGRLLPQIVYYVSAYCDLLKEGKSGAFNVVVPTGNFGNILAAFYAKCMGVPVDKLICASNRNNVLTDFIADGTYDRNRGFYTTISPSMDILISSNLERLLYHISGSDSKVRDWMKQLSDTGCYTVDGETREQISSHFVGGCADDAATKATIKDTFDRYGYLCDTHTAVAVKVYNDYVKATGDDKQTVIVSTASPYKFAADVLDAIHPDHGCDAISAMAELSRVTGVKVPKPLEGLDKREVRFKGVCEPADMAKVVYDYLKIN